MSKALSWNTGDIDFDMRAAARQAARLEGLSVSEWLSSTIAAHAAAKDVDVADLGAEERALAVNERLRDVMGARYQEVVIAKPMSRPEPTIGTMATDAADPVSDLKARLASSIRATASALPSRARTMKIEIEQVALAEPTTADAVTTDDVNELAKVEAKLNALFRALDRTPGATDRSSQASDGDFELVTPAAIVERSRSTPPVKRQRSVEVLPEPFRQAVDAITRRQAILDADVSTNAVAVTGAAPDVALQPFTPANVGTDHAPLLQPQPVASTGQTTPEVALGDLGDRIDALSARIDLAVTQDPTTNAIDRLSERIEQVQQTLAARVSLLPDNPPAALAPLETMIQSLIGKVDVVGQQSLDLQAIGPMLGSLASKLDDAQRPQAGSEVWDDLRQQIGALAGRIERSDAGLTGILAIEQSLGELFSQMEETREATVNAVEGAARAAARDTLRAHAAEQGGGGDLPQGSLSQELAQFRTMRDTSDQRLHAMLGTLNQTLEKVITRLISMDTANRAGETTRDRPAIEPAVMESATARPVTPSQPANQPGSVLFKTTPDRRRTAGTISDRAGDPPDVDFPLEPGGTPASRTAEPRITDAIKATDGPAIKTDPQQYIVAARRAAQAAAMRAGSPPVGASANLGGKTASSSIGKLFSRTQRRPLLLGLAGLILLIGALQVARLSRGDGDANTARTVAVADAPATTAAAPATIEAEAPPANPDASPARSSAAVQGNDALPASGGKDAAAPAPLPAKTLPTLALGIGPTMGVGRPASADPAVAFAALPVRLRDMANVGNASAQYEVGLRLAEGRGIARDPKASVAWFEKAAKQDLAPAAYRLGSLYEKGLGVNKDLAASVTWYSKAADLGNVRAMHNLAVISAEGAGGKSDYAKAATWFAKASQMGVRDSQFNLAILYARGLGIEQSLTQSYMWFAIAAAQGDEDAAKKRDEVAGRLDAKALASAKEAAQAFHATPADPAANEVAPPADGWDAVVPPAAPARAPGQNSSQSGTNPRVSRM